MPKRARPFPVIVDTSHSPHARLRPVPITSVSLTDGFWAPRLRANRQVTIPSQFHLLEETGRIDNFRRVTGVKDTPFQGRFFNDSDVYKWLEAAAWAVAKEADPTITRMSESVIKEIAAAQEPDGYLNSYFAFDRAAERWTNLRDMHELYCAGHLIQAAVAHHRATGERHLLQVAQRLADQICKLFGDADKGKRAGTPGHEEIEMALVELARETGSPAYLRQARYFVDARGQGLIGGRAYHQDHRPFRDLERMAGHAVRAVYLNAGAADIYAETGDRALHGALDKLWHNMTERQMYVSGGIGSRHSGEAFGEDYELPNARAYAETCAAIGSIMWNWRMLILDGEARYADALELVLYNAFVVGLGLDGTSYFYENPLADDGSHRRQPWFECACCPPNVARLLASLPGYFYTSSDQGIWVHLYAAGTAELTSATGQTTKLIQHGRYPWDGEITIEIQSHGTFGLHLRIPTWCSADATLHINGKAHAEAPVPGTYAEIRRNWRPGDSVVLNLPMPVRRISCHPYVTENLHRVALVRGPVLYCLETVDNPEFDLRDVRLRVEETPTAVFRPDLLGGVVEIQSRAYVTSPSDAWSDKLYRPAPSRSPQGKGTPMTVVAVPYYAWANRTSGQMRVWLPTG